MTPGACELLEDLGQRGIVLRAEGEGLAYSAPAGAMTGDLRAMLAGRKPELLAMLRSGGAGVVSESRARAVEPSPPEAEPASPSEPARLRVEDLRQFTWTRARALGFPSVRIRPAEVVLPGEAGWRLFIERSFIGDIGAAVLAMDGEGARRG